MNITNSDWQLLCVSLTQKQELLAYAAECNVKLSPAYMGHFEDPDLYLSWWGTTIGIGSLPTRLSKERQTTLISAELFTTMCQAFAEAQPGLALLLTT